MTLYLRETSTAAYHVPAHDCVFAGRYCQRILSGAGTTLISQSPSGDTIGPANVFSVTAGVVPLGPIFHTSPA